MNEVIELHDSEVTSVSWIGAEAIVELSAYVHRSAGRPGADAGTGWLQSATLRIGAAWLSSSPGPQLPATISDGFLRIGNVRHDNVIPASGTFADIVELSLVLYAAETLVIRGQRVSVELHGESVFVEDVPMFGSS